MNKRSINGSKRISESRIKFLARCQILGCQWDCLRTFKASTIVSMRKIAYVWRFHWCSHLQVRPHARIHHEHRLAIWRIGEFRAATRAPEKTNLFSRQRFHRNQLTIAPELGKEITVKHGDGLHVATISAQRSRKERAMGPRHSLQDLSERSERGYHNSESLAPHG